MPGGRGRECELMVRSFHVLPFVDLARDHGTSFPAHIRPGREIPSTFGECATMIQCGRTWTRMRIDVEIDLAIEEQHVPQK